MTFPIAFAVMGATYWPFTLALALIAVAVGACLRGGWRIVWFAVAGILLSALALGGSLLVQWQSSPPG